MTSPAPIPTERLEELLQAMRVAVTGVAKADGVIARHAAEARYDTLAKRLSELLALRQQAQPTREEHWKALDAAADGLKAMYRGNDADVAPFHAMASKAVGAYFDALKSIDAPAREAGGEMTGHCAKCGRDWGDMSTPPCNECPPAEPAAHSLQTEWVMVPREPTPDMRAAALKQAEKVNPGRSEDHIKSVALDALGIFRAMLAASPPPPSVSEPVADKVRDLLNREDVRHALEIGRMGRPYSDVQGYLYMAEQYRGHSSAYAAQFTDYGLAHAACVLFNVADELLRATKP